MYRPSTVNYVLLKAIVFLLLLYNAKEELYEN